MKKIFLSLTTIVLLLTTSCTQNERTRQFGGSETVELPQGQKLVMVTWKENNAWYLTKPMITTDSAETYTFQEKSSFGIFQGTMVVKEKK